MKYGKNDIIITYSNGIAIACLTTHGERISNMDLNFKRIQADDIEALSPFFCRRPNKTCDSVALDSFLWRDYYNVQFAVSGGKAVQWLMEEDGVKHSAMPMCEEQDLPHYFY